MINISDIYKKLKDSELDFFEEGGATHLPIPDFLNDDIDETFSSPFNLPSEADIAYAMNYRDPNTLQPIDQSNRAGIMMPEFDLSQGNTSSTFFNPNIQPESEEELTLAQELQRRLGITVPGTNSSATSTNGNTEKGHTDKNYDNLSFAEAWKQARSVVGPKGTFNYKGKRFTTVGASDNKSTSKNSTPSKGLSGEEVDFRKLKSIVENNPKLESLKTYSPQLLRAILSENVGSGEAQQLVKQALNGTPSSSSTSNKSDIEKQKELIKREKQKLDIINQKNLIADLKKPKKTFNFFQEPLTPKEMIENFKSPKPFFRGPTVRTRELGGEIEEFAYGGPMPISPYNTVPGLQNAMSSIVDPTTGQTAVTNPNQGLQLTPEMDARLRATGQNQFRNFIGSNGQMRIEGSGDQGLNLVTAENNLDRYYIDEATGEYKPIRINKGQMYDGGLDAIYNTQDIQNKRGADDDRRYQQQMGLLSQLQNGQQYDTSEDLRMLGQGLAFNANDNAKYTNDTSRGIATGLNTARTVAAGLDFLVGGARELYGGFATQKRQQNVEDSFYRRQRNALENQQQRYALGGGVDELLAMFEEGGGNPNDFASAYGEQDKRAQLSAKELLTGEFIQQAPPQAGVEPNAEVENKEFVQHPDGEVQKVVGRTHSKGGERLSLEPGTTVISDKVKLGAKNAKMINNQYDLKVKAGDTFASVVDKYTKKVGLNKLNDEQTKYFSQLEKVTDQEQEEQTSELNNSFLSKKINDLEQQKSLLETTRGDFTSFIYELQEGSKSKRDLQKKAENEDGGEISEHALGSEVPDEPKTLEELIALNNSIGTNSMEPSIGGDLWDSLYYKPMNQWQQYLGVTPTDRKTHLDYQKDVGTLLKPQLKKLIENGEMGLTNKHRALLQKAGVKGANSKTSFKQLTEDEKKKLGNVDDFVMQGYEDGLAGHRGVTVLPGDATEEEYQKMTGSYDKLTDTDGRKIYAKYNKDGSIQKTKDGKMVFYYPKTGETVPENKAPENTIKDYKAPKSSTYQAPFLPSQRPVAPSPASPVPVYQTRLDRLDPVNLGYDQQVSEINRQSNAVASQLEGLTDSQRTAALTNLSANTQQNIAGVVNSTAVQNAMNQFQVQQANLNQSNAEEQARLGNAKYSDELWMRTEANQEADNRDYQEALQRVQLGKFRYLQKDRQIQDMIENFKVGADGGIDFDPSTATLLTVTPTGDQVMQDARGRTKVVKTTKTDSNGNTISGSTSITKQP